MPRVKSSFYEYRATQCSFLNDNFIEVSCQNFENFCFKFSVYLLTADTTDEVHTAQNASESSSAFSLLYFMLHTCVFCTFFFHEKFNEVQIHHPISFLMHSITYVNHFLDLRYIYHLNI